jgi:hypothetical protein
MARTLINDGEIVRDSGWNLWGKFNELLEDVSGSTESSLSFVKSRQYLQILVISHILRPQVTYVLPSDVCDAASLSLERENSLITEWMH